MRALVYRGTEDNPQFVGPAPFEEMSRQIHSSVGPSGPNKEYLLRLAEAMKELAPHARDDHLYDLERAVRALEAGQPIPACGAGL